MKGVESQGCPWRRFPDFTYITRTGKLTNHLDCVIISHFHLDHCGALPYMSEMVGYDGPIYMTHPTKAICPILLYLLFVLKEDYRKITVERKGESNFFTSEMIKTCMKKVIAVNLHQTIQVDDELEIKAYYAGHVLGAAMFHMRVGNQSVVYTVLIPVFALGRAQELCILLESYWERMNLKVPIYFSLGLTEKANHYYKLFITWTSQKIKKTFVQRNMFEFKHIKPFDRGYIDNPGPMVVFATPGMLHAGLSLQIFKKWATSDLNMVIMPGYCVAGTVGHKILSGIRRLEMENKQVIEVKMKVEYMSFSAHADAKGIMQLISSCEPKNVLLVHGEAAKMDFLKAKIQEEFGIDCFKPANGETVTIETKHNLPVDVSLSLLKREASKIGLLPPDAKRPRVLHGALVMKGNKLQLIDPVEALKDLGLDEHHLRFTSTLNVDVDGHPTQTADKIYQLVKIKLKDFPTHYSSDGSISISDSVLVQVSGDNESKSVLISWSHQDEDVGSYLLKLLREEVAT
ncbi:hypothetical protein KUTeg_001885 [Tegillarca granosa]|uniref:Integrator complex subunit 11 n=1 Tax=Tegillarca granosa TaxID=220873 RepID=A0ABQ9FSQ9_TEGGR|nr:hypothetical protein KUTeg_001885 [Tegillarca granosa]